MAGLYPLAHSQLVNLTMPAVVLRHAVEEAELRRHCADLLSDYKVPETFRRLEGALPRNANGKVLKRNLPRFFWREARALRQGESGRSL
jgi:acyl-CoA synthetase (AMP-forming)/AMP-acid ligase II